jgi:hypothetical protein
MLYNKHKILIYVSPEEEGGGNTHIVLRVTEHNRT